MRSVTLSICSLLLSAAAAVSAQSSSSSAFVDADTNPDGATVHAAAASPAGLAHVGPFSRVAVSAGISSLGINVAVATNINRYMNLRGTGNVFDYTVNNFTTNGFTVGAKLNLASAGASVDFYPFPNHGFRLSPGVLLRNDNNAAATFNVVGGTSFTLNDNTYYASSTNPVMGFGNLGLNTHNPAFTATTGWGNIVSRKNGGHWSFPFEIGVAFTGQPALNIALTSGQVCDAQGLNCVNVATDPSVQANLQAQIAKYKSDLDPLKTYPIVSFGVGYSFHVRSAR